MKYCSFVCLYLVLTTCAVAQLTIVSTYPANNATNVPLNITLSTTFNTAVDTTTFAWNQSVFSNIDSSGKPYFSPDGKTVSTDVYLKANTMYFAAIIYAKGRDDSKLQAPGVMYFTTGAAFPPYSVSGTVFSGSTGVSPQNSIVGISKISPMENDNPFFVSWANVNSDGTFTIPYVVNGTYWPIAAKDVNNDGSIDPSNGLDVIAVEDTIVVNNASITNLKLTFFTASRYTFAEAMPIADSLAKNLPSDRLLKSVRTTSVDTLGRADYWRFSYTYNGNTAGSDIGVSMFSDTSPLTDPAYLNILNLTKTLANPKTATNSPAVITNVENGGGRNFRLQSHPDSMTLRMEMALGDMSMNEFGILGPDVNQLYWGVSYSYVVEKDPHMTTYKNMKFLCSFSTGVVVKTTRVTNARDPVPSSYFLSQNYPNPFNPTTTIEYQIPVQSFVTLSIFDLLGSEVGTLVKGKKDAGIYSAQWNASGFASGMYLVRLHAGSFTSTKKILLMK